MLEYSTAAELMALTKYERIAVYLFRTLTKDYTAETMPRELFFNSLDIVAAMNLAIADGVISGAQANVPDVKYTFDARRHLPAEIEQLGPMTWLSTGKGKYKLMRTKRRNLMPFPNPEYPEPPIEDIPDQTPRFISAMLGRDEQATFTRVRNAGLISAFLGFQAWPIQGHHRTTVSFGQIEVDEVQAGMDKNQGTIVPISGKGGADMLSWSQARNLNAYGAEKAVVPGVVVRSVGLWRDNQDTVWIVEYSPHLEIDDIQIVGLRRFRFL
jgi:hypothetical protein